MKNTYYLLIAGLLVLSISACNTDKSKETISTSETSRISETKSESELVLNPPHGDPGHRCDIPVGQALPEGTIIPTNTPAKEQLQSPLIINNPKLNPPHGEPGHRCDIPVGQSLP